MSRPRKLAVTIAAIAVALLVVLLVPETPPNVTPPDGRPFVWGRDALWTRLERRFDRARAAGCPSVTARLDEELAALDARLDEVERGTAGPDDSALDALERQTFEIVPRFGACQRRAGELVPRMSRLRRAVKERSERWSMNDRAARDRLYRLLYGSRAALEELLLQVPPGTVPALMEGDGEPSRAPSVRVHGVTLHSGDVLLSRGGAPTSALIARGNDYPGNFSHVALLHVSEDGTPTVIESHIESGVGTSSADRYLEDTKLRILVLRLRSDLDPIVQDPLLPHRAAQVALERARAGHVAYDFPMDWQDGEEQFCSEVAYAPYAARGVRLWQGLSSMSGRGLTSWLGAFGVRHFETLAPSDLEYDPQVRVVAEWRDPQALFSDHLDNAVSDALLARAEQGEEVGYDYARLPLARLAKAYSVLFNVFGGLGPIPEGMSATVALRVQWLQARHRRLRARLEARAAGYRREHHRRAPYWTLVAMATEEAAR